MTMRAMKMKRASRDRTIFILGPPLAMYSGGFWEGQRQLGGYSQKGAAKTGHVIAG